MEILENLGSFWEKADLPENLIVTPRITEMLDEAKQHLYQDEPKSVLVVGESGVGKSVMINCLSRDLHRAGWQICNLPAVNLMAGQIYIGQLEGNVKNVVEELQSRKKLLWSVPQFQDLHYLGRYTGNPNSILDQIMPALHKKDILVVGEIQPRFLEKLLRDRPQLLDIVELIRISEASQEESERLAMQWIQKDTPKKIWTKASTQMISELASIVDHYQGHKQSPGRLIDFLKQGKNHLKAKKETNRAIELSDFVEALSNSTGLPKSILDDRERLDLTELRNFFNKRVMGQSEAVDTLVDRIAMIKAGLTDPDKPSGVFLFVGPTGTGKTEIAKALSEFLFNSPKKMIRLDMSEFQTYESMARILGDRNDNAEGTALVNQVRENPFCVILLDEFEKSHQMIWDFFLQIFDDGRLTDQLGRLVDFRHAIIIMTSNLGAGKPSMGNIGFGTASTNGAQNGSTTELSKTLKNTFRPEFLNRIDRIVSFNPLSKTVVKEILKKELKMILKRRGLRQRQWALEIEDSATEFLMEKGFSADMGARPMKRAIEEHLLAPLAITIVNNQFPEGDQFLFVSADGKGGLKVDFIDAEEPEISWTEKQQVIENQQKKVEQLSLTDIVAEANGELAEFVVLKNVSEDLHQLVNALQLKEQKEDILEEMSEADFWSRDDRHFALSDLEFIDNVQETFDNIDSVFERLNGGDSVRVNYNPHLLNQLANRMHLLGHALQSYQSEEAQDAYMLISSEFQHKEFLDSLEAMYLAWARKRSMTIHEFGRHQIDDRLVVALSFNGFGAFRILRAEEGIHLLEKSENKDKGKSAASARVRLLPKHAKDHRQAIALPHLMSRFKATKKDLEIVRRYKQGKSPLIRDLRRKWRTGNYNRILQGDFDLMS